MDLSKLFNTWLGLAGLAVVLYYVFNKPADTVTIIGGANGTGGVFGAGSTFVNSLEAR